MEEKKYSRYTFILIALTTIIRIYLASTIGLGIDEAHYVQFALHPALSYYDHPPLIGYIIRFFIIIIGKSILAVRTPAILAGIGTAFILFFIGKKLYDAKTGFWAVIIFNCIPLFSAVGGITVVPDTILCFLWLILLFIVWQIYLTGKKNLWYSAGIITGLMLLTKYTAFVAYPSLILFILFTPSMRKRLKEKEPYIAFLISIALFLPVLIWNHENYWASFIFQFTHGLGDKKFFNPEIFFKNIGAQAGVFSLIFFFLVYLLVKTVQRAIKKEDKSLFFASFSLPVILLFLYSGLSNEVLPHWPAVGFLTLLPVAGNFAYNTLHSHAKKYIKYLFLVSLITGGLLTIIIPAQIIFRPFPLPSDIDITQDIIGWKQLAERMKEIKIEENKDDFFVFTHKFYIASQLAYYLEPEIPIYCLSKQTDQYDFWQFPENLKKSLSERNGLFFCDDTFKKDPALLYQFREIEEAQAIPVYHRENYVKNFYIYKCYGFNTEKTDPAFLQSLHFTPKNLKSEVRDWNNRYFFLINKHAHKNKIIDTFFLSLTWLGSGFVLIPLVLLIVLLKRKRPYWRYIAVFLLSLIIGGIIVVILKENLNIPRPFTYFGKDNINILGPPLKSRSFPSGHSQTIFTGVLFLSWLMPKWSILFCLIGILSGISRCFVGAHFPIDIIAGSIIAIISFLIVKVLFERRSSIINFYIKNKQTLKKAVFLAVLSYILLLFIPHYKHPVYTDTQEIANNIEIIKPLSIKIFAPFTELPLHLINMAYPKGELLSWFIWLSIIWALYAIKRLKKQGKIKKLIRGFTAIFISLLLFAVYGIFTPIQRYKLVPKNNAAVLLDLHSHTIYSHDGLVTPAYNMKWHYNYGFKCWAITEHNNAGAATILQENIIRKHRLPLSAIPSQEVKFKGVYFNLLGIEKNINPKNFNTPKELIDNIHNSGGAVIIPHIWAVKKTQITLKELVDAGVDGFEITGISSVPLTLEKQREIINLCQENNLVMVSGTNWHGWNNLCTDWTSFETENWEELTLKERKDAVITALKDKEINRFRAITYQYNYPPNNIVLAPLQTTFSYITSLDKTQQFLWIFWIILIYLTLNLIRDKRRIVMAIWLVFSALLFLKSIYFFELWLSVREMNNILLDINKGLLTLSLITLFMGLTNFKRTK